jgi:hypothetical protein
VHGKLRGLVLFLEVNLLIDQIPTPPTLHKFKKTPGKFSVFSAEEMNKILAVWENEGLLLTLNSIAKASGGF